MILFLIIFISLILVFISILIITKRKYQSFKNWLNLMFIRDESYAVFNFGMSAILFLVFFVTLAATYNTFIDKNNPNYYKKHLNVNR